MLSLEAEFREKIQGLYRVAPLDAASFHRSYNVCDSGDCAAICCNGGSGFYLPQEAETIRELAVKHRDFFEKNGIPVGQGVFDEEKDEEDGSVELCTKVRNITYPAGVLPPHFPSTACIFRRESDAICTLQLLSTEQGKPGWWFKPLACWLFPIELEYDGKPFIRIAHESTDEYIDEEYPGFTGFTKCGSECKNGRPAYKVVERELATLSKLLDRDLLGEILAYKEAA